MTAIDSLTVRELAIICREGRTVVKAFDSLRRNPTDQNGRKMEQAVECLALALRGQSPGRWQDPIRGEQP